MKKLFAALSCTALMFGLCARPASADQFSFTFSGPDNGSGLINAPAVPGHPGEFQAQSISGVLNGTAITALIPPAGYPTGGPPDFLAPNDNFLFYPPTAQTGVNAFVDVFGLSFVAGGQNYNLYYGSFGTGFAVGYNLAHGSSLQFNDLLTGGSLTDLSATAATPEPSSLILLGTGILGMAGAARRRLSAV